MGRNPLNVKNVGRPLVAGQPVLSIKGFTMRGNPMSAVTVGKPLRPGAALPCTRKSTTGRSLMNDCGKSFQFRHCVRGSTLERSPMSVQNVEGLQWDFRPY